MREMAGGGDPLRTRTHAIRPPPLPPSRLFRACRLQAYFRYPLLSPTPLLSSPPFFVPSPLPPFPRRNSYLLITRDEAVAKLVQKYAQWRTGGHRLSLEDFRDFWRSEQAGPPPPPIFIQEDAGGADATLVGGAGAPPQEAPPRANSRRSPRSSAALRKRPHEQVKRVIDLAATARAAAEASAALDEEAARLFELVASFDAGESHGYSVHGAEPTMKQRDFQRLLLSNENSAIDPKHNRVHMDMTRPLSHYWIHSSHNTYLVGNQLSSESSADMYRRALAMGCRCIEIDCFDGPYWNEPLVYHKFSATTKISLRSVLEAINECAFPSPTSGGGLQTDYPVILLVWRTTVRSRSRR